ncbi:MAG TPA: tetratricopeptide repeat protein [Azospirillaceae bacterium]|nr:tetratricopeptide repeat protein [Azospirillaceae bacterium]
MTSGYEVAVGHHHAGRPAEAVLACRAALAAAPSDINLLNLLGVSLFATGDRPGAVAVLRDAVGRHPAHAGLLANLALVLQEVGDWMSAAACLRRLLILDPASEFALGRLGTVAQEIGDLDASLAWLARAVRVAPRSAPHRANLALAWTAWGNAERAELELQRLVALSAGGAFAHVQHGETLLRLGRIEAAAEAFQQALSLAPDDRGAQGGLARCQAYRLASAAGRSGGAGLVVRAPFNHASGYAHMGRRFIQSLRSSGVPLQVLGLAGDEVWRDEPLDRPVGAGAVLNMLVPQAVERVPGLATVTFSMFEGTRIPSAWRRHSDSSDLVIVPCAASRHAWALAGFPEDRLRVCPLGVDPEPAAVAAEPLPLRLPDGRPLSCYRHRFLNVSDFIARKNIDGLLRVWFRTTTAEDDAVLILKLGKGAGPAVRTGFEALMSRTEGEVGRHRGHVAPILLLDQHLSEAAMTGLFRAATHYISLSHGEGWDLPLSKAGAMDLELIAPAHSAYLDYLDASVAHLVPSKVGPARQPYSSLPPKAFFGLDWWEPDEAAAAAILRHLLRGDAVRRSARDHLARRFSWAQAAERLSGILRDAGLLGTADRA